MGPSHDDFLVSESSTIPNTPELSCEIIDDLNGDFARLYPANRLARIDFIEVAKLSTGDEHIMRHMYVRPEEDDIEDIDESGTEDEINSSQSSDPGYFALNLEKLPSAYRLGWILGRGRSDLVNGGIDFKLTGNKTRDVAGRHARLFHNAAGIFMIGSDARRIVIDGKEEFRRDERAISSPVTAIGIGDLTYRLVFTGLGKYSQQLSELRKQYGGPGEPSAFLDPTPSGNDYVLGKYTVKSAFAQGSTCMVSSGVNRLTGCPVAIKKMKRHSRNSKMVDREIDLLKMIGSHPRICELIDVLNLGSSSGTKSVQEMYLIYSPLADKSLYDIILSDMEFEDRIVLLKQVSEAIEYLHSKGIMHRDIKPENVAIASSQALVIDFGSAILALNSADHMIGTIRYLAPEVFELKSLLDPERNPYTYAMDIWGIGLLAYQVKMRTELFSGQQRWPRGVYNLVEEMLRWSAPHRPSAAETVKVFGKASHQESKHSNGEQTRGKRLREG